MPCVKVQGRAQRRTIRKIAARIEDMVEPAGADTGTQRII